MEISEGLLAPLQERVSLHVAVILDVEVEVERLAVRPVHVHLHRVIDDQIDGDLGVDLFWIPAHFDHSIPERCQVNNRWNTSEILKNDARRAERYLAPLTVWCPCCDVANVLFAHQKTIVSAQCTFEKNTNGIRQ